MSFTVHEFLAIVFRQKRLVGFVFGATFGILALVFLMQPNIYDAEMKILVNQNRVDPMVSPDQQMPYRMIGNLTEQDLTSEAELLKSRDILENAAVECSIPKASQPAWAWIPVVNAFAASPAHAKNVSYDIVAISEAARHLDERISVIPSKNSNLISVVYPSKNPTGAACILKAIAKLYLDKHLAVHRPSGAFEFFKQEADRHRKDLESIETQLAQFGQKEQLVTDGTEKDLTVRKLGEYEAALIDTKAAITSTQARIRSLNALRESTDARQTKAVRTSPNGALKDIQNQLVGLEMKRTEMLGKFNPNYRPLQDLEKQIEGLKQTIAEVQKVPMVEETTDTNPANDWLLVELARARSELASLQASAPAKQRAVSEYRSQALDLDQKNLRRTDLVRIQKATEEKYLLYLRKEEEARIEQELDRQRILNVAIAQEPSVPVLPEPSLLPVKLGLAGFLASLFSIGGAFGLDYRDRTFRTRAEIARYLEVPVLGSLPLMGTNTDSNKGTTAL